LPVFLLPLPAEAESSELAGHVIGVYVDEGADPFCTEQAIEMFEWMGLTVRELDAQTVNRGDLADLAALYFPGGDSPPYIDRISPEGKQGILDAVENGMVYIGTCAGSMFAAEVQVWRGARYTAGQLGVFRGEAVGPAPGIFDGEWCYTGLAVNLDHPAAAGCAAEFRVLWYNSPYLAAAPGVETHVLATYAATGDPAIVAQRRGEGWAFLTGPHPEYAIGEAWKLMRSILAWCLGSPTDG